MVVHVKLFSDIGHAKNRLGMHMHIKPTKIKTCMYRGMYTVGALKYDDIRKGKICDRGTT